MALVAPASPPVERWEPAAGDVDPEHLVCGLAASLRLCEPRQFGAFLDWHGGGRYGEPPIPLRCDHQRWRASRDMGVCLEFASVPAAGDFPGGLVVLAALHPDFAPSLLRDMRRGQWLAMSAAGVEDHFPGERGDLLLTEVSLVSRIGEQADPGALVIGTGRGAAAAWELLTGG